jgi:hypothetical protein
VQPQTVDVLADRLARFERVVEVGIGHRTAVAAALSDRCLAVVATDIHERAVPEGVSFVCDDVTDPDPTVYADAGAIYALNLPPELHRPTADLARSVEATFYFTTLGGDPPTVPVERETLPGETLFRAKPEPI